jgi:predicted kinase
MSVIIVAGPTCSGKTTFIKNNFPNHTVIDLFDFQKDIVFASYENIMQSYIECRDALVAALKRGEDVVLEHTLLKAMRREMYINAIRSVTDAPVEMYFLMPSDEQLFKQMKERKYPGSIATAQQMKQIAEIPTTSEGYAVVHVISDDPAIAREERDSGAAR